MSRISLSTSARRRCLSGRPHVHATAACVSLSITSQSRNSIACMLGTSINTQGVVAFRIVMKLLQSSLKNRVRDSIKF